MNWKDKAKSSFAERRTVENLRPILVPEWDVTVYYWPDMTLAERREIFLLAKQQDGATVLDMEAMAVTLIIRGRDKDGKRIWHKAEKIELMNEYDPEVIARIVSAMNTEPISMEDAEKN
jgi:hypothetical protein